MLLTEWFLESLIPVVMAGILAVYSLVIAVLLSGNINPPRPDKKYALYKYVG